MSVNSIVLRVCSEGMHFQCGVWSSLTPTPPPVEYTVAVRCTGISGCRRILESVIQFGAFSLKGNYPKLKNPVNFVFLVMEREFPKSSCVLTVDSLQ